MTPEQAECVPGVLTRATSAGWVAGYQAYPEAHDTSQSGPVEAAAKTLVKTRMCRSGMRWSRPGGRHVLSLRTYLKSGRWDAMWQRYKAVSHTAA